MNYFMRSSDEAERLLVQEGATQSRERLVAAGLRAGMRVIDVGCGAGAVLPLIRSLVGQGVPLTALEPTTELLGHARERLKGDGAMEFVEASLPQTGLPGGTFDFVWSQFVFEYLRATGPALDELVRLARPGGRVVVSDIDGLGAYWPLADAVEAGKDTFLGALGAVGFDLYVGRKMFHAFRKAGLRDVQVHLAPFHFAAGPASAELLDDWQTRFRTLAPMMLGAFGSEAAWARFRDGYLQVLRDPDTLKFGLALTTWGTKA